MSNVLPFVSNWMNDVFSQLFVQYVKRKKNEIYAMLFKNCRCPLPASSNIIYPLLSQTFDWQFLWCFSVDSIFSLFILPRFMHEREREIHFSQTLGAKQIRLPFPYRLFLKRLIDLVESRFFSLSLCVKIRGTEIIQRFISKIFGISLTDSFPTASQPSYADSAGSKCTE